MPGRLPTDEEEPVPVCLPVRLVGPVKVGRDAFIILTVGRDASAGFMAMRWRDMLQLPRPTGPAAACSRFAPSPGLA